MCSIIQIYTCYTFNIYQEENEVDILGYRLLVPEDNQDSVYLYNDYTIIMDNGQYIITFKLLEPKVFAISMESGQSVHYRSQIIVLY
jgi:hypothetical protein